MIKIFCIDKEFFKISFKSDKECYLDKNCPRIETVPIFIDQWVFGV